MGGVIGARRGFGTGLTVGLGPKPGGLGAKPGGLEAGLWVLGAGPGGLGAKPMGLGAGPSGLGGKKGILLFFEDNEVLES